MPPSIDLFTMTAARNILVFSDNTFMAEAIFQIASELRLEQTARIEYACSPHSPLLRKAGLPFQPQIIKVKEAVREIVANHDLVISIHCKQLFPAELVRAVRCINLHPGFNPYNRGWFPQVFSIINKQPLGATLHEIDEQIDHGAIIAQEEVPVHAHDTSLSAYNRVMDAEIRLLRKHLAAIVAGTAPAAVPRSNGNLNLKKDFVALCHLNLTEFGTLGAHIDRLRALTHGDDANAFFVDPTTGGKIFVRIQLTPESTTHPDARR